MSKVNLEVIKPWITKRVTEILGFEDDVVIEFIFNQLEVKNPDSKMMQINLTGFLNGKNAREFMGELWPLLLSAQENIAGIPSAFLELKKEEIKQRQVIVLFILMREVVCGLTIEQEKLASMKKQDEDKDKRDKEEKESSREKRERSRSPRSHDLGPVLDHLLILDQDDDIDPDPGVLWPWDEYTFRDKAAKPKKATIPSKKNSTKTDASSTKAQEE
ncbi:Serine/arginine repetitive matrix protein 1 [Microtus ochrogaster]|uniref:Serine/arginine repetitive matrix protein 1 n=1 Tax=Microtus ochrogaster TaxID=79684 RepID=A0A8J6G3S7_MICOH|nr:Serine/arginine repetitive matrix protein 1 [Microtus ochrogaster]